MFRSCATCDCPHRVRTGLIRDGRIGVNGQHLADGVFCCKCRLRHAKEISEAAIRRYDKLEIVGCKLDKG